MLHYNLLHTLGLGVIAVFAVYLLFLKVLRWPPKMASLATAALVLLIYVPLGIMDWAGLDVFTIHFAVFMMVPYGLGIIFSARETALQEGYVTLDKKKKKRIHWVPAAIIVFFLCLAVVDSIIITFATKGVDSDLARLILPETRSNNVSENISSRFTGAVSYDLQDREHDFDQYVMRLQEQRKRGWKIKGGWLKPKVVNEKNLFYLLIQDKSGEYVNDVRIDVYFRRHADMSRDLQVVLMPLSQYNNTTQHAMAALHEQTYVSPVNLNQPGCWEIHIKIYKDKQVHEVLGQTEIAIRDQNGTIIHKPCINSV